MFRLFAPLFFLILGAMPAWADFKPVTERNEFVRLITGKTLSRPFVKLQVSTDGTIAGRGARWDITGDWSWQGQYFCRDLFWGGDPLGYNCQEVRFDGRSLRFRSDKGTGDYADFRLN